MAAIVVSSEDNPHLRHLRNFSLKTTHKGTSQKVHGYN